MAKLGYFYLCSEVTTTATATVHSTIGGRKFSDYDLLFFFYRDSNATYIRATAILPAPIFPGIALSLTSVDAGGTQHYINVTYVSDSSVRIEAKANTIGYDVYIIGLKISK